MKWHITVLGRSNQNNVFKILQPWNKKAGECFLSRSFILTPPLGCTHLKVFPRVWQWGDTRHCAVPLPRTNAPSVNTNGSGRDIAGTCEKLRKELHMLGLLCFGRKNKSLTSRVQKPRSFTVSTEKNAENVPCNENKTCLCKLGNYGAYRKNGFLFLLLPSSKF